MPDDLPEFITIDITNLKIHESVKVGDLSVDKIQFLDPRRLMVLTIATSRVAQKTDEELALEAAAEEEAAESTSEAEATATE